MAASVACSSVDVIKGGTQDYSSYWSMSAGPEIASFPVMTTGGPADDSSWLEISDFEYGYVIVRQNIAAVNVGEKYDVSLAWSMSTNTSSYQASCTLLLAIDSTTILGSGQSAAGVRPVTGSWETATATYTPTASTGIPFVITVSCSEGASSDSPIIGLADISMVYSTCSTTASDMVTSSFAATTPSDASSATTPASSSATPTTTDSSTTSDDNLIPTDALSTMTSSVSTESSGTTAVSSTPVSTTASSTTSTAWTASTGTITTDDDGTSTLSGSTTDGDSAAASVSVDTDDSTSAVSGTVSVTETSATRKRDTLSCTLYVSQGSQVISTTVVDAGSSAPFTACLAADSSEIVDILVECNGSGGTVIVSGLTVKSGQSAEASCPASSSATSSSLASTSAVALHHTSTSAMSTPAHTGPRPSRSASASNSPSSDLAFSGSASPTTSAFGSGSSSGSSSDRSTSTVHSTYLITDTITSYTTICPVTATETLDSSSIIFAGSSVSENASNAFPIPTTTQIAHVSGSVKTSHPSSELVGTGSTETVEKSFTISSLVSHASEGEGYASTTSSTSGTGAATGSTQAPEASSAKAGAESSLSTNVGAFAAESTTVDATSNATGTSTLSVSSTLVSSPSTAASESLSIVSTVAPVFNGALSNFSPSLTGVIGVLIALFM